MRKISNKIELMIPDERWFDAPAPMTWRYFPVFSQVARALHQTMRDELPKLYFRDPSRFSNLKQAYPMLVFQASRPCNVQTNLYCHDVLDQEIMDTFFRMSRSKLIGLLNEARVSARVAGDLYAAEYYNGRESKFVVESTRKNVTFRKTINKMLVVEAGLLHDLIAFSGKYPREQRARRIADFNRKWHIQLRRFCGSFDFTEAAPKLLAAATSALINSLQQLDAESDSRTPYDCAA